ncbi:MAG: hypothetical protein ABI564_05185 [Ideonella sp.]
MIADTVPVLNADALIAMANRYAATASACSVCSALVCQGWESMPAGFASSVLRHTATLKRPDVDDPTLNEHHPAGTNLWSADAPIAPAFYPFNRCDVWQCSACSRPFLRYTEYGGYYQDDRIRELHADRVDERAAS